MFGRYYFVGTDAVSSNVGHATGAIAYLRRERGTPLIFASRCGGHITVRAWKHGLEQQGLPAQRSPIKRKADEASIPGELLVIEDLYYIEKKWPALGEAMQARSASRWDPMGPPLNRHVAALLLTMDPVGPPIGRHRRGCPTARPTSRRRAAQTRAGSSGSSCWRARWAAHASSSG